MAEQFGEKAMKKKIVSLFFAITIVFAIAATGCVGPRTGSVGYRNTQPILTTNLVGTVTVQQVGEQLPITYAQTNFTVTSTPPIQERTWKETVLGQRPPMDTQVVPPFPNAGVYGVTGTAVTVPQGRTVAPRRTSGPRYGIGPTGARYLLPGRYGTSRRLQSSRVGSGRTRTYATVRATVYTYGRVNVPRSGWEKSARGHARQMDRYFDSRPYGTRVKSYNATVVVAGGGQFRSGLRHRRIR